MLIKFALLGSLGVAAFAASYLAVNLSRARHDRRMDAPPGMVWIPGGEFTIGADDENSLANERPAVRARIDGFWMDKHDVTNAEFREFVAATGYITTAEKPIDWDEMKRTVPPGTPKPAPEKLRPGSLVFTPPGHAVDLRDLSNWWTWTSGADWRHPQGPESNIDGKDEFPVVQVSWDDAAAYAKWAGKRLPTEAEWEYASRGGASVNTRFWWGNDFRVDGKYMCNTYTGEFPIKDTAEDGYAGVSPWNAFPPNGYGLYDMAGNVWQWTADFYRADAHALLARQIAEFGVAYCTNPAGPADSFNPAGAVAGTPERVVKGGSFLCNVDYCESYRPTARRPVPPDTSFGHIGFRCAVGNSKPAPETARRTAGAN